jgi:hypothetical protein
MIAVPMPLPACVAGNCRGAQADARSTAQVLNRGAQAVACGAARCFSQILITGAIFFMQKDTQPRQTCAGGHIKPNSTSKIFAVMPFAYGEYKLD